MMQRMSRWTLLLVLAGTGGAATLTAQSAATAPKLSAKTPAECTKGASDWRNTQLQPLVAALRAAPAEQRNDALATYNATYPLVLKESVRAAKECATAFSWETIATSQLADLVTLYAFISDSVSRFGYLEPIVRDERTGIDSDRRARQPDAARRAPAQGGRP